MLIVLLRGNAVPFGDLRKVFLMHRQHLDGNMAVDFKCEQLIIIEILISIKVNMLSGLNCFNVQFLNKELLI